MAWYDTNYLYKKKITQDHTKVVSTDQLNYPMEVAFTDPDLKTVANGGKVQNSNGWDIIFTDSTENTKLDHEIDYYNGTTGQIVMHVRIPTLSHSADTVIYIYLGNTTISSSQENQHGVWDSNYNNVYHLGNGSTLSVADSTSNANSGTNHGATATVGQIDGAAGLDGSSQYITAPSTGLPTGNSAWTASAWGQLAFAHRSTLLYFGDPTDGLYLFTDVNGLLNVYTGASGTHSGGITLTNGHNYYFSVAYDGSNLVLSVGDVSGASFTTTTLASGLTQSFGTSVLYIGNDPFSEFWPGWIDEVRISTIARSSGWAETEYNNQSAPSSFFSVGALQSDFFVLYGSDVADGTLTTACDMAQTTGGVETSKTSTFSTVTDTLAEILSQGGSSPTFTTLPTTPSHKGWVFQPGAGTFAAGNWTASVTVSSSNWGNTTDHLYLLIFQNSTLIGTLSATLLGIEKTTYSLSGTALGTITTVAGDVLEFDLIWQDRHTTVDQDNPVVYISNTVSGGGVANDMQITTPGFLSVHALATKTRAQFSIRTALQTQTRSKFLTSALLRTQTRSKFYVQIHSLVSNTRAKFAIRTGLVSSTRSTFKIKSLVFTILSFAGAVLELLNFKAVTSVANPNSTITSTTTVTDQAGAGVTTLSTVSVVVTFPDQSTTTYTMANGDINSLGSGRYQLKYTTKNQGLIREVWSVVDVGGSVGQFLHIVPVTS